MRPDDEMGDATVDAAAALDELELGSFLDSLATAAGYLIAAGSVALYAPIAARVAWQGRASADGLSLATWCAIAVAPSHTRVRRSFSPRPGRRATSHYHRSAARDCHTRLGDGGGARKVVEARRVRRRRRVLALARLSALDLRRDARAHIRGQILAGSAAMD